MKWSMLGLAALCYAATSCVVVTDERIVAGDLLDARFELSWTINDAVTGIALSCAGAGADTVQARTRNLSTGEIFVDLFPCNDRRGLTDRITAGDYTVTVSLLDCRGDAACLHPFGISRLSLTDVYGMWRDDDIDLGHFVFLVD